MNSSLPAQTHEQRKIERLLIKLAKMKPIDAKPAPIAEGVTLLKSA
jgi:hypothetical protein